MFHIPVLLRRFACVLAFFVFLGICTLTPCTRLFEKFVSIKTRWFAMIWVASLVHWEQVLSNFKTSETLEQFSSRKKGCVRELCCPEEVKPWGRAAESTRPQKTIFVWPCAGHRPLATATGHRKISVSPSRFLFLVASLLLVVRHLLLEAMHLLLST